MVQSWTNSSRGSTMRDPIERFGKTLLQQQVGLCEVWRKANCDTLTTPRNSLGKVKFAISMASEL